MCEAEQGAPLPGLPARQTGPPGEGEWGFWIFEGPAGDLGVFFLVVFCFFKPEFLLHVDHWREGGRTPWGAVVAGAPWPSSVACSW